jgi:DNA-binding CsgD family transcriptional regulator
MSAQAELLDLVGEIYDCAIDANRWPAVLHRICDFVRTDFCMLVSEDFQSGRGRVFYMSRDEQEWLQSYFDTYLNLNPLLVPAILNSKVGDIIPAWSFMPYEEFRKTRFYLEWVKPKGIVDVLAAVVDKSVTSHAVVTAYRHERQGRADAEAHRRMKMLIPHLRRAVTISNLLELHKLSSSALMETLDGLSAGIFLLDRSAQLIHANKTAQDMLAAGKPFRILGGGLVSNHPKTDAELRSVLEAAAGGDKAIDVEGVAIPVTAGDGEKFVANVLPLAGGARLQIGHHVGAVAALFVRKASIETPSPLAGFAQLYNLTDRELSVLLAIVEIGGVPAVASVLGLSKTTVKSYLKSIFAKTGTRRQADLAKIVVGLANPFSNPRQRAQ